MLLSRHGIGRWWWTELSARLEQIDWIEARLTTARSDGRSAVVFMHSYPADLGEEAAEVAAMIDASSVVLVDMGHTAMINPAKTPSGTRCSKSR
jgi:hypothetical protein